MGRHKAYSTPGALRRGVQQYFDSIRVLRKVTERVPTGELTAKGRPVFETREVLDLRGEVIVEPVWIRPPTVSGLCLALGISRMTWDSYGRAEENPELAPVVAEARAVLEAYLEEELLKREKGVQGVIFNLQNNYGWREKREVELGEAARRVVGAEAITMAEKLALIREVSGQLGAEENGDRQDGAGEG